MGSRNREYNYVGGLVGLSADGGKVAVIAVSYANAEIIAGKNGQYSGGLVGYTGSGHG